MTLFVELLPAATYNEAASGFGATAQCASQREPVRPANHLRRKPTIDD
jgi:hypothetical protein